MAKIEKSPISDDAINQSLEHKLFVEGSDEFDVKVLKQLFESHSDFNIEVIQLGKSKNVSSAAENLYPSHPNHYFVIDRDCLSDEKVEESWNNFPNSNTNNLLIWRKREIENYFLDPKYIVKSRYIKPKCDIEKEIINNAQERLFSDIANRLITEHEHCFKKGANKKLEPSLSREKTFDLLVARIIELKKNCSIPDKEQITDALSKRFNEILVQYTKGGEQLELNKGSWLDLISGKEIMNTIFNNCFDVKGDSGQIPKSPKEKTKKIVEDLLKQDIDAQPKDFRDIVEIIKRRVH